MALGFLFSDKIDKLLESPTTVTISMLAGGIILLFIDRAFNKPKIESDEQISYIKAFLVGIWQTIAMIPGGKPQRRFYYWWYAAKIYP